MTLMETTTLQDNYDFEIKDSEFRKAYQKFLTPQFMDFWIENFGRPEEFGNEQEYYTRMAFVLIGWKARGEAASNQNMEVIQNGS